jgi:hypothetical protein
MPAAAQIARLFFALFLGGLVAAVVLSVVSTVVLDTDPVNLRFMPENFLWYAPFLAFFTVAGALTVGFPSFLVLRHFGLLNWFSFLCVGMGAGVLSAGVLFSTARSFGAPFALNRVIVCAAAGAIGALCVYFVLLRSNISLQSGRAQARAAELRR